MNLGNTEYWDYFDIKQARFKWPRSEKGYYWDKKAKKSDVDPLLKTLFYRGAISKHDLLVQKKIEGDVILDESHFLYLIEKPESTSSIFTEPLETTDLFLRFAELQQTEEDIKAFADIYGLLTEGLMLVTPNYSYPVGKPEDKSWRHGDTWGEGKRVGKKIYEIVRGEDLEFWSIKISKMNATAKLWELLVSENYADLEKSTRWEDKQSFTIDLGGFECSYSCKAFPIKPGDTVLAAKHLLLDLINSELETNMTHPTLALSEENKFVPYFYPDNLLSAMWYQFFQAVIGERKYKRCKICGDWADVTEKNSNWKRHEKCATRKRVDLYRARKKAEKAGGE